MASDADIERALTSLGPSLNEASLESFDRDRVEAIITEAVGGSTKLTVDNGGGLHDESGARIGAVRRTDSGEWIVERQNPAAERSEATAAAPKGSLRSLLSRFRPGPG